MMLSGVAPPVLYHYTGAAGLFGILQSSTFWASNIHYLNDSKEFQHAIECAQQVLHSESKHLESGWRAEILKLFGQQLDQVSRLSILVASLSEESDSLSQWRGYCPAGGGYAVGFDYRRLSAIASEQGFCLSRCSYLHSEQQALMKPLVGALLEATAEEIDTALNVFLGQFVQLAPLMKHASFKEEREWRLVSGLFQTNRADWQVRVGRTMLIPFTPFKIGMAGESALCEVVVGPTPHQSLASGSVASALNKAGIKGWSVRHSQTSFRDW